MATGDIETVLMKDLPRADAALMTHIAAVMTEAGEAYSITLRQIVDLLVDGAPVALDTWLELVAEIQDNESGLAAVVTALAGKVPSTRQVATSGLASGGGDLTADRTISVPKSSQAQAQAGTDDTTAMTPARTKDAIEALRIVSGGAQASLSGTAYDITSIPATAKKITIFLEAIGLSGSAALLLQIGDAGGIENTGYDGSVSTILNGTNPVVGQSTTGAQLGATTASTIRMNGKVVLELADAATNKWLISIELSRTDVAGIVTGRFYKSLSQPLDRFRITSNASDTLTGIESRVIG